MGEPNGNYRFAGVGFTGLSLDFGTTNSQLKKQASSQPLNNLTYDGATGRLSFQVTESPANVKGISFTGNIINDVSGNLAGLAGTWKGERALVVEGATRTAERAPGAHQQSALRATPPPSGLTVEGSWAAILNERE